ncbi:MAG: TonB-dependent receptor [Prevotella sp.]|nr:TonB-dependent receptor [Prevotella sp.]
MIKFLMVLTACFVGTLSFAQGQTDNNERATPTKQDRFQSDKELQEVVVTGTRNAADVRHLPMTVNVVGRDVLTADHQPSVLPTVMQQVPGLFLTSRSMMGYGVSTGAAGGLSMRGIAGGAGQLLVLIDGHPQYNGIYGHPISDSYQTLMAERVEVLRGPASVLYGSNAMGGVLNIVTRGLKHDGVRTHVNLGVGSYGTVQTEATNQVRSGKFSSTVAAEYNRTDNHRPRMGFEQYGGHAKLGYDFTPHWSAFIDADITHFNASYPGTESVPMYSANQWITRGVVSAAVRNDYGKTNGELSVFTNFGRHKIDDGTKDEAAPTQRYFRSKDALTGVSWYQSARLFEGNRLTVGVDYQHIYGHAYYTSKATGEVMDTPNKQSGRSYRNEIAGYVEVRQDVTSWLTVDAGLRLDHHSITGTEWIPQGGLVIRPMATGELKAMASKGFRNPTMREMYLYPPSNTELEPERLWNYELSWRQRMGSVSYGVNLFYIKGDNMIQTVARKNVNTGEVENYGLELEAAWRIDDHWTVNTNHSFLHMNNPVLAAPEYKGWIGGRFRQGKWSADAGLQIVSGLFTQVETERKKENFCLLNASVNYQLCKPVSLWLRGENLLAQRYEIIAGYPMPRATFMGGASIRF